MNASNHFRQDGPNHAFYVRALSAAAIALGLVLLVAFLWYAVYVLLLLFTGVLLAIFLSALASVLTHKMKIPNALAIAIVLVFLVAITLIAGRFAAPSISAQFNQLVEQAPQALAELRQRLMQYDWARWMLAEFRLPQDFRPDANQVLSRLTGVVSGTVSIIVSVILVLFVGVYLAANPSLYTSGVLRLMPIAYRRRGSEVLGAVGYTLRWWIIGQLIAMTAVGMMTTAALWLLGMPLALLFGVLAFLLDFVPNFGPILAAAPAVLLALSESPQLALWVAGAYLLVQQTEGLLIMPIVQQRTVSLPPVLTITAQILLGILAGPIGLLLATPLTAAALVLVKMLYIEQALGDELETPDDNLSAEEMPAVPESHLDEPSG